MQLYYEFALGDAKHRGQFLKEQDVSKLYVSKYSHSLIYRSVWLYDQSAVEYRKKYGSMAKYDGVRYIREICFDIDKKQNTDEYTYKKAIALVQYLEDQGLDDNEYQIYWSGSAWHIHTPNFVWGFKESKDLPYIVKESMRGFLESLGKGFYDESIYNSTSMFRLEHSFNTKAHAMLYKIPVSKAEFLSGFEHIKELARGQRLDFEKNDFNEILNSSENKLNKWVIKETHKPMAESLANYSKIVQKSNVAMCIHRLIEQGASDGNRNQTVLRIATHLRRNNIPEEFVIAGMLNYWNNKNNEGLDPKELEQKIRTTYRSPYNYGCNDKLLQAHCRQECIFYQHKNYSQHILSTEDMMNELQQYKDMDREGRTLDLANLFGVDKDLIFEPGDFIVIIGGTGVNKTTFIQQIMLGMDFRNGEIDIANQIPTLFIELELTTAKLMRRFTQLICGVDKKTALLHLDTYKEPVQRAMSNIVLTREVRTIANLRQKIIDTQAKLIVIDYLQCFKDFTRPTNEMTHMQNLSHELRDLATEMGVIIIALSQVPKSAKQEKSVTMESGKGSGDISDSATCIITINGQPDDIYRNIKFEKVTDGDTITDGLMLEFNKNEFRLEMI